MRIPSLGSARLPLALAIVGLIVSIGSTASAFRSQSDNPANSVTAAADFRAPTVTASAVGKTQGGATGFVKKGGTYFVYANVTDTGNPASGIASVTANLTSLTAGATAVTLTAGSFTAGGQSYNYRSAQQTAGAGLAEGAVSYSIATTDNASNSATTNWPVMVDNTPPFASDVQTANASGGTVGKAEQNDTVTFTFSEPVEPGTILAGWDGSATPVAVEIVHSALGLGSNDILQVFNSADTTALPLGTVDLGRSDYVNGALGGKLVFGASGTASTMTMSGSTLTVALGHLTTVGLLVSAGTAGGNGTMVWTPTTTPTDRAANSMSAATATESGASDREF